LKYQQQIGLSYNFQERREKKKVNRQQTKPPSLTCAALPRREHDDAFNDIAGGHFWISGGVTHAPTLIFLYFYFYFFLYLIKYQTAPKLT